MTDDPAADILALEAARSLAIVRQDALSLERLLADEMIYTHGSGLVDSKRSFIALALTGRLRKWSQSELQVRFYDRVAVVLGCNHVTVLAEGVESVVNTRFLNLWVKQDAGWRNVATQATVLPS